MNIVAHAMEISGRLPASYEHARDVLASCASIDECQDWADKAAALASYARQADDKTLENYAVRIRSRAIRRAGELLKEYDARGDHRKSGDTPTSSQREVAEKARMSKDQQVTAVRVANVPAEAFEGQIESDSPPTVTALAEQGKKSLPRKEAPLGFAEATSFIGEIEKLHAFLKDKPPSLVLGGMRKFEIADLLPLIGEVRDWLQLFIKQSGGPDAVS